MRTDEACLVDCLVFVAVSAPQLTCGTSVTEPWSMVQTQNAHPGHLHLDPRDRRIAIAASGLIMAIVVLFSGAERAAARVSADRNSTPVTAPEPTTTTVASTPPAPANAWTPPPTPAVPGQEATVEIPSLGVSVPVVRGGQDVIDRGVAAHYTGTQWRPPIEPGQPGTYWLAAHNSTHGAPFESLHAIAQGAEIRITEVDGTVLTYVVTARDTVGTATTFETVYGQDATASRILLQTCEGAARRLLVHGTLTSVTSG
jgi:LPXTG-site transpeptidase (sortase) family protein